MQIKIRLSIFFIITILSPLLLFAAQDKGSKEMIISGGKKGDVFFPHRIHQAALKDCAKCHNLFPQTPGSIEKLKADKKLAIKQVMKQCKNCHKAKKGAGEKTGPTGCRTCHNK